MIRVIEVERTYGDENEGLIVIWQKPTKNKGKLFITQEKSEFSIWVPDQVAFFLLKLQVLREVIGGLFR